VTQRWLSTTWAFCFVKQVGRQSTKILADTPFHRDTEVKVLLLLNKTIGNFIPTSNTFYRVTYFQTSQWFNYFPFNSKLRVTCKRNNQFWLVGETTFKELNLLRRNCLKLELKRWKTFDKLILQNLSPDQHTSLAHSDSGNCMYFSVATHNAWKEPNHIHWCRRRGCSRKFWFGENPGKILQNPWEPSKTPRKSEQKWCPTWFDLKIMAPQLTRIGFSHGARSYMKSFFWRSSIFRASLGESGQNSFAAQKFACSYAYDHITQLAGSWLKWNVVLN